MELLSSSSSSDAFARWSKAVENDPTDFASWSKLLAVVEEQSGGSPERVAPAFEAFLARFPLCFGYWCKYADLQRGDIERTTTVYERAVSAVPLSVELWKSYCAHVKVATAGQVSDVSRATYERAVDAVGRDPQAGPIWDAFLEFEADRGTPETVCRVYRKMLAEDSSGRTDDLWRRFKLLAKAYKATELVSEEEARDLLMRYNRSRKIEAEDDPAGSERLAGYGELHEQRQLEQLLGEVEKTKNDLVQRRLERQHFEAGVRRWYFHVKPLDAAQLQNWRDYLDLEIERGDASDVGRLFERCLVPCALYAEFWIKYAWWSSKTFGDAHGLAVIDRAATTFLPDRVDVLECRALLLERLDKIDKARDVFGAIFRATVSDPAKRASCSVARANFERRQNNRPGVLSAYRETIDRGDAGFEAVAAHMARYLVRVENDLDTARSALDDALERAPEQRGALWIARAQIEFSQIHDEKLAIVHDAVAAVYERALAENARTSNEDRLDLWARYWSFSNDFGHDATLLLSIRRRYASFRRKLDRQRNPFVPPPPKRPFKTFLSGNDALGGGGAAQGGHAVVPLDPAKATQRLEALLAAYGHHP
ncbi:hypothetical protein CTAYLR_006725 [Chrysophaeum taylorii]|uniref:Suppressor of forked domain-containing protein n=1 Tax=Chrysophaeum taylorii TaxID=2483200 RepID=A0AAD7XKB6_9STRA|nr:hypothetical protein CTAYLR_006725 [Chrysophaeum taylorii]